jgi:hypothetical protein
MSQIYPFILYFLLLHVVTVEVAVLERILGDPFH